MSRVTITLSEGVARNTLANIHNAVKSEVTITGSASVVLESTPASLDGSIVEQKSSHLEFDTDGSPNAVTAYVSGVVDALGDKVRNVAIRFTPVANSAPAA